MKKKYFVPAIFWGLTVSMPLMAAQKVPAYGNVVGHVSVVGADTVDQAELLLNKKAKSLGGNSIRITGMGGKNKLFATADVLK